MPFLLKFWVKELEVNTIPTSDLNTNILTTNYSDLKGTFGQSNGIEFGLGNTINKVLGFEVNLGYRWGREVESKSVLFPAQQLTMRWKERFNIFHLTPCLTFNLFSERKPLMPYLKAGITFWYMNGTNSSELIRGTNEQKVEYQMSSFFFGGAQLGAGVNIRLSKNGVGSFFFEFNYIYSPIRNIEYEKNSDSIHPDFNPLFFKDRVFPFNSLGVTLGFKIDLPPDEPQKK